MNSQIIGQGALLVQNELNMQVDLALTVRSEIELRNSEILSDSLIINRDIHQNIKNSIQNFSENIRKIIAATAFFIEEENFKSMEESITELNIESRRDKSRSISLVSAQKDIRLSYGTLIAVTEIFKKINQTILSDINSNELLSRSEKTKLLLKNSILVYEFTNFMIHFLKEFQLSGISDLMKIRDDVFDDLKNNELADNRLRKEIYAKSPNPENMIRQIDQRDEFRSIVRKKWEEIMQKLSGQESKLQEFIAITDYLELNRDNAKNTMDMLNIAATTMFISDSVNAIEDLANGMGGWELPELDAQLAKELLNISED